VKLIVMSRFFAFFTARESGRTEQALTSIAATDKRGIAGPPGWRIHQMKGDRAGTWSISVSGNWRITFDIEHGVIAESVLKRTLSGIEER
jgi:proteic killer suppression protein